MPTATFRLHTGPSIAPAMARAAAEAGLAVHDTGTEAIHVACEAPSRHQARDLLRRALCDAHGTDFGLTGAGCGRV